MKLTILYTILFLSTQSIICQQSINTSGGNAVGSGSVSYTLGQLIVSTNSSNNGSITHGVQLSLEIFTLSNPELSTVVLKAKTYPNPTKDKIILSLSENQLTKLSYFLYDTNGKAVKKGNVNRDKTSIKMNQFSKGIYFLRVYQNTKPLKVFKIVKN